MFGGWLRRTGFIVAFGLAVVARADAASPGANLTLLTDEDDTFISPDSQIRLEQYSKKQGEDDLVFEFWTFDRKHQHGALVNRNEADAALYPAGFRFSPDSQLLVRMQKIGAGSNTVFLYRRNGYQFSTATPKPLGEMVWDYFFSQPVSRKMHRKSRDRDQLSHAAVNLVKGMEENFAWLGKHWPDSRYIVLALSFDAQGEDKPLPWIDDWWCVFDTKTDRFSIPADFTDHNAETVQLPNLNRR